jgi:hypothetical protein
MLARKRGIETMVLRQSCDKEKYMCQEDSVQNGIHTQTSHRKRVRCKLKDVNEWLSDGLPGNSQTVLYIYASMIELGLDNLRKICRDLPDWF